MAKRKNDPNSNPWDDFWGGDEGTRTNLGGVVGGAVSGVGKVAGGTLNVAGDILAGTRPGRAISAAKRTKQEERYEDLFNIIKGDFSDEAKEGAARQYMEVAHPNIYKELAQDPNHKFWNPERRGAEEYTPLDRVVDLAKVQTARDRFTEEELSPETAAAFDAADRYINTKGAEYNTKTGKPSRTKDANSTTSEHFPLGLNEEEWPGITPRLKDSLPGISTGVGVSDPSEPGAKGKAVDNREMFGSIDDYYRGDSEVLDKGNVPKTYEKLGVSISGQATLQEMQKAMPDKDMKQEYEENPENMERLIKLWQEKKLNKKNIGKAFSAIQDRARQSLGLG